MVETKEMGFENNYSESFTPNYDSLVSANFLCQCNLEHNCYMLLKKQKFFY
jgi:hypothetical protein